MALARPAGLEHAQPGYFKIQRRNAALDGKTRIRCQAVGNVGALAGTIAIANRRGTGRANGHAVRAAKASPDFGPTRHPRQIGTDFRVIPFIAFAPSDLHFRPMPTIYKETRRAQELENKVFIIGRETASRLLRSIGTLIDSNGGESSGRNFKQPVSY